MIARSPRPRSLHRRALASLLAVATLLSTLGIVAGGPAQAQEAPVATPIPLPLSDLGLPGRVVLRGVTASQTVALPTDAGLFLTAFEGVASVTADVPSARVEFSVDDHRLAVLDLVGGADPVPFSVPLAGVAGIGGPAPVPLLIRTFLPFADAYCRGRFTVPEVHLDDLRIPAIGLSTPPTTVATFLPSVLRRARIWVSDPGSEATTAAAIRLGTSLVHRYRTAPPAIDVLPLGADGGPATRPFNPIERDFVIGDPGADDADLAVTAAGAGSVLLLPRRDPSRAIAGLFDELAGTVTSDVVEVVGRPASPEIPAREQRLLDLGLGSAEATGTGRIELELFVPQAAFGGMTERWQLRLTGRHTPGRHLTVSVLVNEVLVDTVRTSDEGRFSLTPSIVEPVLDRDNTVRIIAEQRDDDGPCSAGATPFSLQVSSEATIDADLGPSLPVGFRRLPQALMPVFDVSVSDYSAATVASAVGLAAELQRLSPIRLGTDVRPLPEVVTTTRPALVVWAGRRTELDPLDLPVGPGTDPVLDLDARSVTLTTSTPILQVARRAGAPVLVAAADTGAGLSALTNAVVAERDRFRSLVGDVAVLGLDGHLRFVQTEPAGVAEAATGEDASSWPWIAAGASGALVLLAACVALLRRRRPARPR